MPESNGIVQSNPMNNTHGKHTHNYSSFPDSLAYKHYMTLRFGEYTPTFVMDGEPKDEISLNTRHLIDSLSLNAPFKGTIRKITESFMVPKMAILPLNWDRIYTQPANGDDVPKDANCVIQNFPEHLSLVFTHLYKLTYAAIPLVNDQIDINHFLTGLLRFLVYGEYFLSAGSLPAVCGYHSNSFLEIFSENKLISYDKFFDRLIGIVFSHVQGIIVDEPVGSTSRRHYFRGLSAEDTQFTYPHESFRAMLELFRENPACNVGGTEVLDYADFVADVVSLINENSETGASPVMPDPETPAETGISLIWHLPLASDPQTQELTDMSQMNFNLSRILAYQLVCAHYYSNSAIDFVYSAELYRQYVNNLCLSIDSVFGAVKEFSWNGIQCPYDYLSGHFLTLAILDEPLHVIYFSDFAAFYPESAVVRSLCVCSAIFGFRKSLRFGDYFVGSRPRPLAPVNTDVSVNNNMVSVIDVTRGIQAQRFANSVMRSRSKIENYVRDLFGKSPAPDYHNPFYLTRQAEIIYGDEVQNTADSQVSDPNSRTANFKSGDARFTFTFHNDDAHPCVYLQIVSFDIKRAYTRSIDRHFMHLDRFDMFNPDFQYIGDQPVYGYELGYTDIDGQTIPAVFGYQGRDMEYKQRFDVASGGFVENLPGWILTDIDRSIASVGHLDPDFIRSYNTELDQFFLSLNGFGLASYFHFVCVVTNNVSAKRAMAVDPQILE